MLHVHGGLILHDRHDLHVHVGNRFLLPLPEVKLQGVEDLLQDGAGGAGGEVGMGGAVAPPTSFGRILRSFGGDGPSSMGEEEVAAAEFPIPPAQRITEVFIFKIFCNVKRLVMITNLKNMNGIADDRRQS